MADQHLTTRSEVMATLLAPLADAELRDSELERLEQRARSEAKARAKDAWHCQWMKCKVARFAHDAADYRGAVARMYPGEAVEPDPKKVRHLFTAWQKECLRLMHVPAPTKANLNEKRRLIKPLTCTMWGDICADEKKLKALIAADEERLARR